MNEKHLIEIILKYKEELHRKIEERENEMRQDSTEHYLMYHALGFSDEEGYQIDFQQNVGRFLYKYAGSMLEELVINCLLETFPEAEARKRISNTIDKSPKTVEIDCLIGNKAFEIKWRDATTDGDHIKKEQKRIQIIKDAGYQPIRLMFFEPNRSQAVHVQLRLKQLYEELGGEYYSGNAAWDYLKKCTGIDLKKILEHME